jgi:hypothetical protein
MLILEVLIRDFFAFFGAIVLCRKLTQSYVSYETFFHRNTFTQIIGVVTGLLTIATICMLLSVVLLNINHAIDIILPIGIVFFVFDLFRFTGDRK